MNDIVFQAANVTPSPRQVAWQELEFIAFIHFTVNSFTNREWGDGTEDPSVFNPTEFDAAQWVNVCRDAGMKMLVLTVKHHDGFCLWPSRLTKHTVSSSPWRNGRGDIVREVADACREGGIKFGVYVSPWDRHEPCYGDSPAYNEFFRNQLRELLTDYGPVYDVWFDGACGEGPNGKMQVYDWDSYYRLIRELQPEAVISVLGPDVRWCGNEAGETRATEWSVVPTRMFDQATIAADSQQAEHDTTALQTIPWHAKDLGGREAIRNETELMWYPAETNTSIRPGWFYHPDQDDKVKSLAHLLDVYYSSVGGNSVFLLNLPPDTRGLIHENDARRMRELGAVIRATFRHNLAAGAAATASQVRGNDPAYAAGKIIDGNKETYWSTDDGTAAASVEFDLNEEQVFNRAMLQEQIRVGQRIESFALDAWNGKEWCAIANATTVGHKRLLRFGDVRSRRVRVRILESRICPTLSNFGLFHAPSPEAIPGSELT